MADRLKTGATEPRFVHLHVHSSYSLLEGALTIARLAELAKKDRQPALALTDTDNMFGALEFSEKMAGGGIQPIVGCALAIDFGDQEKRRPRSRRSASIPRIVLLAAREEGYRSLMRLCSRAYLETPPQRAPHIKLDWLDGETDGLIALSGGPGGPLDAAIAAGQGALAPIALRDAAAPVRRPAVHRIAAPRHRQASARSSRPLIELAYARGIPLVATNEPFFATREDYEAHDALLCIAEGRLVADARTAPAHAGAPVQDAAPKWRRCSPICRRRWPRPSRSPSAARSGRARRRRSCRDFPAGRAATTRLSARGSRSDALQAAPRRA